MSGYDGLDEATLSDLLAKAHEVVTWTTQDTLRRDAAGLKHLIRARQDYLRALVSALASIRPLTPADALGCVCGGDSGEPDTENCMYHYAASLQPDNHRIPWNCPTFYDGCNCEEG